MDYDSTALTPELHRHVGMLKGIYGFFRCFLSSIIWGGVFNFVAAQNNNCHSDENPLENVVKIAILLRYVNWRLP